MPSLKLFTLALVLTLCSAIAAQTRTFAPYVDMGKPANNLAKIQADSGIQHFTLAFIVAGESCVPSWGGATPLAKETKFAGYIEQLRAHGGDAIIAFGGYDGLELAQVCSDATSLQAAYQAVIDHYRVNVLDFDVEHTAIEDQPSIDRRSQVLKSLAAANRGLQINYTLPATPAGLTPQAVNVLKSAVQNGTPIAIVNVMAMDYSFPVPNGAMGTDAVAAAAAALCQMKSLGLDARVGITPMIGVNDTAGEVFSLADAQAVFAFAQANSNAVGLLSFWSAGRDNGGCNGIVSPTCSGIAQEPWAFTRIFRQFEQ